MNPAAERRDLSVGSPGVGKGIGTGYAFPEIAVCSRFFPGHGIRRRVDTNATSPNASSAMERGSGTASLEIS